MDAEDREPYGTADGGDSARWMTFAELGAARGISKASAIKLIRRHGWRRQRDNQGHVRALVPLTWAEREGDGEPDSPAGSPPDVSPDAGVVAGALAALKTAVMTLREQLDAANARAERAETRADRAEASITGERQRADVLRDRLDAAKAQVAAAEAAAEQERAEAQVAQDAAEALQRADDARRARGLLSRLRAAWRGE